MKSQVDKLVKIFKALSDPTRVRILKLLLREKSLCVCEVMQALDISQTRASRNLAVLKEAGFLKDERCGFWVHYSIEGRLANPYCIGIGELLNHWVEEDELVRGDKERLKKAVRLGEDCRRRG